jgi:hypothetical protein
MLVRSALAGLVWGAMAGGLAAQADLVAKARAGTARYRDRAVAIDEGYRAVGPDFPGMGEHYVNMGLLLTATIDPARPPVLEYATIDGKPRLVGVAYAALVTDSAPQPGLPVPPGAWHTHSGTVDEESFVLSHAGVHHTHAPAHGPRLAVAHAWIWLDNPAGLYETDNWALPCARLGFAAPGRLSADAGRSLALAAGATAYFTMLVRVVGEPDSAEQGRLGAVLDLAAGEIARRVGHGLGRSPLPPDLVPWLESAWRRMWAALLESASPPVRARLVQISTAR